MVPLNNHLLYPFPTYLKPLLCVVSVLPGLCILGLGTETLHHTHKLRNKICDSVRILQNVFLNNVKLFELGRRILLICYSLRSLIFYLDSLTAVIMPKVRYISILLSSVAIGLPYWVVSFTLLSLVFCDLVLQPYHQMFQFIDFLNVFPNICRLCALSFVKL